MKYAIPTTVVFFILCLTNLMAQTEKEKSINDYRIYYSQNKYRGHSLRPDKNLSECISLLQADGKFSDLVQTQSEIEKKKDHLSHSTAAQTGVSQMNAKAYNRLWLMAEAYRSATISNQLSNATLQKLFKGFINYGQLELSRANVSGGRFHASCFGIPTSAINSYFALFELMDKIETGTITDALAVQLNSVLKDVGMQSWTQPFRNDETDLDVVQVDRFRNHVWWVGGNALSYRSVLPACFMMSSVKMVDVLAHVAKEALSFTSQNTIDDDFWTEGFTADGAGWGHGMQCLIWGYPIDGTSAALHILNALIGSPWASQLEADNIDALFNFFRGSSWYYFNGYIPRCLGRTSMAYNGIEQKTIPTETLVKEIKDNWSSSLSHDLSNEMDRYLSNSALNRFTMSGTPKGHYTGTRWFFNNDDLIKKSNNQYVLVNMASIRVDGIESAAHLWFDKFNFYTCDGLTFFMKQGNEYHQAIGAWNLTAIPGVTARQGEDQLIPITNWRGYCSKHNFAAAATSGGENAASGFIFEKMNASNKEHVNDRAGSDDKNTIIYGVKAHKAWFMVGDYTVALGAGITNLNPKMEGDIWTTIDQTHFNDEMQYFSQGKTHSNNGSHSVQLKDKKLVWASQKDGFAYAILPEFTTGEVQLLTETRKTKWEKINGSNDKAKNLPQTADIFQLHINHGQKVKDGNYAYVVYGGEEEANKAFKNMPLTIEENSTDIQAISWGENYIGASFYNPNKTLETKYGMFQVSAPCAFLLEKKGDQYKLTLTDAEMNEALDFIVVKTTLNLGVSGVSKDGKWNSISIAMPQGKFCGSPTTMELSKLEDK